MNVLLRNTFYALILISTFLASGLSYGSVIVYTNETDYLTAAGSELFFINFDGLTPGQVNGSSIDANVAFTSPEAGDPALVLVSGDTLSDAGSATAPNGVGPVAMDFIGSVYAFSLKFSSSDAAQTVELYDAGDGLIDSVTSSPGGFFGVVSTTMIASANLINGINSSSGMPDRFFIDNLRANTMIPAPTGLSLLGLALLFLGLCRRKV